MKIGIIGMGNIGKLLAKSIRPEHRVRCYSRTYPKNSPQKTKTAAELTKKSETIFIATPSKVTAKVLEEIAPNARKKVIICVSVGFTNQLLKQALPNARVIQLIPSMAAENGAPAYFGYTSSSKQTQLLEKVFSDNIQIARFNDKELAEATALISCFPAFIYYLIAPILKTRRHRTKELDVMSKTITAAVSAVFQEKASEAFITRIRKKGGATEAGITALERVRADTALSKALDASAENIRYRIKKFERMTR